MKLREPHQEEALDTARDRVASAVSAALAYLEDQEGKIWDPARIIGHTNVIMERIEQVIDFSQPENP